MSKVNANPQLGFNDDVPELKRTLAGIIREQSQAINALASGSIDGVDSYAAMPTAGSWKIGDFVTNSAPVEAGAATAKYVTTGWKRITNGTANVLNTDWLECRSLTGN